MYFIHIKHDGVDDQNGGRTGKNRWSIGPYSRKAAIVEMLKLKSEHRTIHAGRPVTCIIKVEREHLSI